MRLVIGVTGTFCTGKTTVSRLFGKLGAYVIDADRIVRQLYTEDKEIKNAVLKKFGSVVFAPGGGINRKKLGKIAFKNRGNLNKLERTIHPKVIKKIKEMVKLSKKDVVIVDAPLLIEADLQRAVDYIVVVASSLKKQFELADRRGFTKRDCLQRRKLQRPLREKIKYADFVIDNNRSKAYTKKQVVKVWKGLRRR